MLNKRQKRGFTVAEILVAAAIFSLFLGALFSIYRMGSRMFVSGSWKFSRQKEGERFFEILKERVEQASNVVEVSTKPTCQATNFVTYKNLTNKNISCKDDIVPIAEFAVCKPKISDNVGERGLILCHSLVLEKDSKTKLYNLNLHVARNLDNEGGKEYFGLWKNESCIPDTPTFPFMSSDNLATEEASQFGLGRVPVTFSLKDVASVTVTILKGNKVGDKSDAVNDNIPCIFGLYVQMKNPKYEGTDLEMRFKAKLDSSVNIKLDSSGDTETE